MLVSGIPDAIRTDAILDPSRHLALEQHQIGGAGRQSAHHDGGLDQSFEDGRLVHLGQLSHFQIHTHGGHRVQRGAEVDDLLSHFRQHLRRIVQAVAPQQPP